MPESKGPLPDIIRKNLKILFVGFNPGLRSGEIGHHYAGHSNRFWKLLSDSGLTPRKLRPEDDGEMLNFGYGLTNIVPRTTKEASEITADEYRAGRERLKRLISEYSPNIAAFNGIEVYRQFSQRKKVPAGLQETNVIPEVLDFVLPSPSGLVRTPYPEILELYRELKRLAESAPQDGHLSSRGLRKPH